MAIYYYHLVDFIWIIVYLLLYIWPSDSDTVISMLLITSMSMSMSSRSLVRNNSGIINVISIAMSVEKISGVYTLIIFDCISNLLIVTVPIPGNIKYAKPVFLLPLIDTYIGTRTGKLYASTTLITMIR